MIRDLKNGVGLNHLPSGKFAANAAWLTLNGVWIFWGESKALFLHLTNRCREN